MKHSSPPVTPPKTHFWRNPFTLILGLISLLLLAFLALTGKAWSGALPDLSTNDLKVSTASYVQGGLWWAACINAVLCAALALTAKWWSGNAAAPAWKPGLKTHPGALSRRGWIALILILAAAGALRWARMDLSFYNDEAHTFRRYIAGQNMPQPDGTIKWRPVTWLETVWLNKIGNNSPPFTMLSRLSYAGWKKISGSSVGKVSESAVRLPAWVAGMASLVLLFFIVRRLLPGSAACYWLLLFAALHPWHLRYSTEARGYGLMLLGISACFYFLLRAAGDGKWRWWLAMGVAQFLTIWAFSGILFFFVAFNGLLLLWVAVSSKQTGGSFLALVRPLFGMLVGAMLTLQLSLPSMIQLAVSLRYNAAVRGVMGIAWWQDVAGGLLAGIRWVDNDPGNPHNLAMSRILTAAPWVWLLLLLFVVVLGVGTLRLLKTNHAARIMILSAPIAIFTGWLLLRMQGKYLHVWYVLYALPGLFVAWSAGAAQLASDGRKSALHRGLLMGLLILCAASWTCLDWHLLHHSKENIRGLEEAVPANAIFGCLFSDADIYNPASEVLKGKADVERLIARAQAEKRPLYLSFARLSADPSFVEIYDRISKQPDFQLVEHVYGLDEEQFTHHLYRWNGAGPQ
ncbi:MAG: hypothetical protein RL693_2341 [Verrucomicrobiota bacterium]|jgi:hypothetical protein